MAGKEQDRETRSTFIPYNWIWEFHSLLSQNLSALKKLKILSIQSNRIVKLEGLEELENLEELYLSHNGIEKMEGLEKSVCAQASLKR